MQSNTLRNGAALAMLGGATAAAATLGLRVTPRPRSLLTPLRFRTRRKPSYRPPARVLKPVWTGVRTLVAISGRLTRQAPPSPERTRALRWWAIQQGFSDTELPQFWKRVDPRAALIDSALLLASAGTYVRHARHVDESALFLLAPYLGWLTFATLLNTARVRQTC